MDRLIPLTYSEAELAGEICHIVNNLVKEGRVSDDPVDVRIERVNREAILPCRRSKKPGPLNLEQLAWASQNGKFWFLGPIKSLKVTLGKGKTREIHVSEMDRMSFTFVLNELNYDDFAKTIDNLKMSATGSGFRIDFSQPDSTHNVKVRISADKAMSAQNVSSFLSGVEKVLKTI